MRVLEHLKTQHRSQVEFEQNSIKLVYPQVIKELLEYLLVAKYHVPFYLGRLV